MYLAGRSGIVHVEMLTDFMDYPTALSSIVILIWKGRKREAQLAQGTANYLTPLIMMCDYGRAVG